MVSSRRRWRERLQHRTEEEDDGDDDDDAPDRPRPPPLSLVARIAHGGDAVCGTPETPKQSEFFRSPKNSVDPDRRSQTIWEVKPFSEEVVIDACPTPTSPNPTRRRPPGLDLSRVWAAAAPRRPNSEGVPTPPPPPDRSPKSSGYRSPPRSTRRPSGEFPNNDPFNEAKEGDWVKHLLQAELES